MVKKFKNAVICGVLALKENLLFNAWKHHLLGEAVLEIYSALSPASCSLSQY